MDVLVGTGEKTDARPTLQMLDADRHSTRTKIKWTGSNPLHIRQSSEHSSNDGQRIDVKHVARLKPAENFSRGVRKGQVQSGTQLRTGRATLPAEMRLVFL